MMVFSLTHDLSAHILIHCNLNLSFVKLITPEALHQPLIQVDPSQVSCPINNA